MTDPRSPIPDPQIAIKVENLTKIYKLYNSPQDRLKESLHPLRKKYHHDFYALSDVSFEVKRGETVGIIGKNGSGKSTLLKVITGVLTPSSGSVTVNGRVSALLELGAGFNPELTGIENAYFNGTLMGFTQEQMAAKLEDILSFADIGEFVHQPVKTYSSGMLMRLAFAVIAHVDADIMVIDEALAVGDAFFVQKCMRFLRRFMETGTVLFVSHDTSAAINLCQTAIWLNKGRCEFQGNSKDVLERYLEATYAMQQGESAISPAGVDDIPVQPQGEPRDMRLDFINATQYRNDIELFSFTPDAASFGKGGATITSVQLLDQQGNPLAWVVGGENVQLLIHCKANTDLVSPIVGFQVKDRLGQVLFADNTFLAYLHKPLHVASGHRIVARFEFRMPVLPVGDYSISPAIAEGTQQDHVQHHWIHDALIFKVQSSSVCLGLIGVPMGNIELRQL